MKYCLLMILLVASCTNSYRDSAPPGCPTYGEMDRFVEFWGQTPRYDVAPNIVTPAGIRVDTGQNRLDLAAIDGLVDQIDSCMYEQFGLDWNLTIPEDVAEGAACMVTRPAYPVSKSCITIAVPNYGAGWHIGLSGSQVLDWRAPDVSCTRKGQEPPCYWRAGMQDGHTIVTVPDFADFGSWYIRVFYGCYNPWGHPAVSKCAKGGL